MIAALLGRLAGRVLSPGGPGGRLSILIFHRVLPRPDALQPDEPTPEQFRWQVRTLAASFRVLPLGEAVTRLRAGTLPPRSAAITFDDGYADNAELALPVLRDEGLTATFFVASGYIDKARQVIQWCPAPTSQPFHLESLRDDCVALPPKPRGEKSSDWRVRVWLSH